MAKFVDFAGKKHAKLVPQLQGGYFKEALYTFDIGQNDIGEGIFANMSLQQIKASVPDIISHFTTNFKVLFLLVVFYSLIIYLYITGSFIGIFGVHLLFVV